MKKHIQIIQEQLGVSESIAEKIGVIAADYAIWLMNSMSNGDIKGDAPLSTYDMFDVYIEEAKDHIGDFGIL